MSVACLWKEIADHLHILNIIQDQQPSLMIVEPASHGLHHATLILFVLLR